MIEIIITSSILILVVLALRFALRGRLSPTVIYALWAIVALRLLVPVSLFDSRMSVMNLFERGETIDIEQTFQSVPEDRLEPFLFDGDGDGQPDELPYAEYELIQHERPESSVQITGGNASEAVGGVSVKTVLVSAWLIGAAAVAGYILSANIHFFRLLRSTRRPLNDIHVPLQVFEAENISSPCIFGLLRPAIYLTGYAAEDRERAGYVITHELMHYRHLDHIWAVVRVVCCVVYWFNPLVWLAAHMSRQDSELACDSAVLGAVGNQHRLDYGRTLVDMVSIGVSPADLVLTSTTMSSGGRSLRERIKAISSSSRTLVWAAVIAVAVIAAAFAITFTGAAKVSAESTVSGSDITSGSDTEHEYRLFTEYPAMEIRVADKSGGEFIDGCPISAADDLDYITGVLKAAEQNRVLAGEMDGERTAAEITLDLHTNYLITCSGYVIMSYSGAQAATAPQVTVAADNIAGGTYHEGFYGFYKIPDDMAAPFLDRLTSICREHRVRIPDGVGAAQGIESMTVLRYDGTDNLAPAQRCVLVGEEQYHTIRWLMRTEEWEEVGLEAIPDSKIALQIYFDDNHSDQYYIMSDGYVVWKYFGSELGLPVRSHSGHVNNYANGEYHEGYIGGYRMPTDTLDTLLALIAAQPAAAAQETPVPEEYPDLLGQYSTIVNAANVGRYGNIRAAAEYIDGTVLRPGEEFSFNGIVGERTEERGFSKAVGYAFEGMDEDYGVGISQTATTLFNAAVSCGFEITEHHTNPYTVDYYSGPMVPVYPGSDAAVIWERQDLRFVNSKRNPVMIRMKCVDGQVTAEIYGTDDGVWADLMFAESERTAHNRIYMPPKEGARDQIGQDGLAVDVSRMIHDNGSVYSERAYYAVYLPLPEIIYTDELPVGCEYYTEYPSDAEADSAEHYYPDELEQSDVWNDPDYSHLLQGIPMYGEAALTYCAYHPAGVEITEAGDYNLQGTVPELDLLVMMFSDVTISSRHEYIQRLHKAGFTHHANDGSDNEDDMCVFYNAERYGVGVQLDAAGSDRMLVIFFPQRDGCFGLGEPVPRG